ncbi:MAG: addiction module antidote protein, HigA family [Clostridia bacterium]|nr:addiction module antidote protein, HigA family [Clostridia bacterium]
MRNTKRRPVTVGEMLITEFLDPMDIKVEELASAMGVHRNTLSRIINNKGKLTAPIALKLAAALGNSPEFWLNIQHAGDIWDVRNRSNHSEIENVRRIQHHVQCAMAS